MEPYKYYNTRDEEDIKNFFSQPKPLQRLAFIGMKTVPSSSFDCVVVTDDFALIERGNITPTRGLHGIFPGKRITFRWHYSNDSKKCKPVSAGVKYEIKRILSETDRYKFVEHVPSDCLCSSVLRDILYGKITNPHDAIMRDPTIIDNGCYLEEEVIHTFATCEFDSLYLDSMRSETNWSSNGKREAVLIECIIPKGTIYIENVVYNIEPPRSTADCYPQYGALCVIPKRITRVL